MNFYDAHYDYSYEQAAANDAAMQDLTDTYPEQPWLDPEDRDLVAYDEVIDPEGATFRRYGAGHAVIIPGAWD